MLSISIYGLVLMKKTVFIKNAAILTVSSLLLRFAGIIFKVWLASFIGSEGIGLYQLIFSVYVLAATFATSGISTAVTRLVTEELALGSKGGTLKILRRAIELSLIIALVSIGIVFFGADFIATEFLGDLRASAALKILPFSLPFMAISSCLRGYFFARRKATPSAIAQLTEQAVRILIVVFLIKKFIKRGLAVCCAAVMVGDVISEALGLAVLWVVFSADRKNLKQLNGRKKPPFPIVKHILRISTPITSGRYLNTGLRTIENILVPKNLSKYALSGQKALSQFGMIKGMALPILFFPSAILNSVSTLLIPEMSEASALKRHALVKAACENILKLTAVVSFIFSAIFLVLGEEIGFLIYKDTDVGFLLKALSPIVPFMYLDSISDGILKGLDQQAFSFRTAISDSLLRIALILTVLPVSGLKGFLGIMYFSNLYTCLLNVGRLIKVSRAKFSFAKDFLLPLGIAFTVAFTAKSLLLSFSIPSILVYIICLCFLCLSAYFLLLFIFGIITKDDIKNVIR